MAEAPVEERMQAGGGRPRLPAGTATFLLTDVEGSSALWEADAERASSWLRRHEEIVRETVARHGGAQPVEQGEGDSSVSVFVRASDAGACAVEIQQRLGAEGDDDDAGPRVRIALHTGEVELRDDGVYRGAALNRCARLRSAAHGGQIVLSQATHEVLVDHLPHGVSLLDLGVHRLRDLARPEHVWELRHPDLTKFPPLRSLKTATHNLPVQLTSFVGRGDDMAAVRSLLEQGRLVTLTGSGGCGKTRLALQLAAELLDEYPDGVWWEDLAPVYDPLLVPAVLAELLGIRESPIEPLVDTVVRHLESHQVLVVLDNCEHLVDASASLVQRLVQGCRSVTVLATSREPLGIEGETTWRVPSLSLPTSDDGSTEVVGDSEAVRLFVDRVQATHPNFDLGDDQAQAVAEICTRLDGIPLAIELAAARVRLLSVEQIAAGLTDRFHLLTGGARTALPRQRTLEASVDWSHDLLDLAEEVLFRRLSVFAGSFSLEAAQAVCAADGIESEDVLDLLSGLVDRSLVQVEDGGSEARYRMLETIRDYARHKITDAGESRSVRERHLEFYATLAEQAETGLEGPDMLTWLERIDAEIANVRAALDWSVRSADPGLGLRLIGKLVQYWWTRSDLTVGRSRLEAPLSRPEADPSDRAEALVSLSFVAYRSGDLAEARSFGDEAIAIARQRDDTCVLRRALACRGGVGITGQSPSEVWPLLEEAIDLSRQAEDDLNLALGLAWLGAAYVNTSAADRARECLVEALDVARAAQLARPMLDGFWWLVWNDCAEGRFVEAETALDEALALARAMHDPWFEVILLSLGVWLDTLRGNLDDAADRYQEALALAEEHGNPLERVVAQFFGANLAAAMDDLEAATRDLEAAYPVLAAMAPRLADAGRAVQSQVAFATARLEDARRFADEAFALGRSGGSITVTAAARITQAELSRRDRVPDQAEEVLHDALDVAFGVGYLTPVCGILDALGGAVTDQVRFEEAARILGASQALHDAIGLVRTPVETRAHDSTTSAVRNALGDEAFDRTYAEGAEMGLDDAVAYVRRGRGERKRPSHGWNSLTPTESQVVELVAEGLTNPQIGERMLISKRTVQTHVSHVFAKLGISSRAELAAAFARRQTESA